MSAAVTGAHLELARRIMFEFTPSGIAQAQGVRMAAQLIADSEAEVVAGWQASLHLKGQAIDSLLLECDRLRAEVKRLQGSVTDWELAFQEQYARAEASR